MDRVVTMVSSVLALGAVWPAFAQKNPDRNVYAVEAARQ